MTFRARNPVTRALGILLTLGALTGAATASTAPARAQVLGGGADRTVAFWSLDEPAGSGVLVDSSGSGRTGTIGADITPGAVFDGATGQRFPVVLPTAEQAFPAHVDRVPHHSDLNPDAGDFSVTIRLRTTFSFGNWVQKGQGSDPGGYWKLQGSGGTPACLFRGMDGVSRTGYSFGRIDDGQWHTIRCVRTATTVEMYVDGVRTSRANGSSGTIANSKELTIGGKGTCDGTTVTCDYFVGDIDFVRIEKGSGGAENLSPAAAFTPTCTGLSCTFDATSSSDGDGAVQLHDWDLGDGTTQATASVARAAVTYPAAGSYPVTLTVTDDRGATGTTTRTVTVAPVPETISFVGLTSADAQARSATTTVAAQAEPGDLLLAFLSQNAETTRTPPAGWVEVGSRTGGSARTTVYRRTALPGDAGAAVTVALGGIAKTSLAVAAYRGVDAAEPLLAAVSASDTTSNLVRTTPTSTVDVDRAWAVSSWMHGDGTTTALIPPSGVQVRGGGTQAGGGRVTTLLADSGASVPRGLAGGLAAVATAASSTSTTWTLLLRPADATPAPAPATVSFVAATAAASATSTVAVVVPADVREGDLLLLFASTGSLVAIGEPTGGTAWAAGGSADGGSSRTRLWTAVATAAEAGRTVTVAVPAGTKSTLTLAAYRGTAPGTPSLRVAAVATPGTSAARTTPALATATPGVWGASYWAHRDSISTSLAAPSWAAVRAAASGLGGGRVTSLLADSAGAVTGTYGGITVVAEAASPSATAWTVLLTP